MWSIVGEILFGLFIAGLCGLCAYIGGLVALDKFCEEQEKYDIGFEEFIEKSEPSVGWENMAKGLRHE